MDRSTDSWLSPPHPDGALLTFLDRDDGFRSKFFRFPVEMDWEDLPVKMFDGVEWVPYTGNRNTRETVEQRRKLGNWPEWTMIEGYEVEYRPVTCLSVRVMGRIAQKRRRS